MILDTNALSAFIDGDTAVGSALGAQPRAAIPVIVLGEFCYGIAGSRHRKTYEAWLASHLRDFDLLPIVDATTFHYATLRAALKKRGRPIPANDVWIAALALQHRLPVLTRDEHFDFVTEIQCVAW